MANNTHICGGTILVGNSGEQEHQYCDSCAAYTYDLDGDVPSGMDAEANRAAWDAGDIESPCDAGDDHGGAVTTKIIAVNIYRDGAVWCYRADTAEGYDHSDTLEAETLAEAKAEILALFSGAMVTRL